MIIITGFVLEITGFSFSVNQALQRFTMYHIDVMCIKEKTRVIYTILGKPDGLVCVILEALDHKNYDILFGYKTS